MHLKLAAMWLRDMWREAKKSRKLAHGITCAACMSPRSPVPHDPCLQIKVEINAQENARLMQTEGAR